MASVFPEGSYRQFYSVIADTNETAVYTCPSTGFLAAYVLWVAATDDAADARTITLAWRDSSAAVTVTLNYQAAIAANAIGASELAADAVTEIQSGLATSAALSTLQTSVDDLPTNAELATALAAADDAVLAAIAALNNLSAATVLTQVNSALDTALTDSVPADGALPTLRQASYMIGQFLFERDVSGTTLTVKKVNGSTTLMTFTLNDASAPTSITRTT